MGPHAGLDRGPRMGPCRLNVNKKLGAGQASHRRDRLRDAKEGVESWGWVCFLPWDLATRPCSRPGGQAGAGRPLLPRPAAQSAGAPRPARPLPLW